MRNRLVKRWLIIALILVLVGTAIYMFLPFFIDEEQYRGTMETGLSFFLGRSVSLKGPITLTFSLTPTLILEDVRIANPSWASHPLFLKATRLEAQLALLPLIDRRLVIHRLFFDGVELHLEEGPDEKNNWTFGQDSTSSLPSEATSEPYVSVPEGGYGAIQRANISYRSYGEHGPEDPTQLTIIEATILPLEDRFRTYVFRGTFRDVPFSLELAGGKLVDILNLKEPWPIDGALVVADTTLKAKGQLQDSDTDPYLEFTGSLSGHDLSALNALLQTDLPSYGPYELMTSLSLSEDNLRLADSRLRVGDSDLAGQFIMDFKGDRTHFYSRLTGETLQTKDFQSSESENDPAHGSPPSPESFAKQIGIEDIDIDLELAVNNFLVDTQNFGKIALSAKLKEGSLSVAPFRAETYGGVLSGRLELDATDTAPELSAELTAQDWDYGQAFKDLAITGQIAGTTNLDVNLRGQGSSLEDFLDNTEFMLKAGPSNLVLDREDEKVPMTIDINKVTVQATQGSTVKAMIKAKLDQRAIEVGIETANLAKLGAGTKQWPISLFARSDDMTVEIKGEINSDPSRPKVALGLLIKGKQLNRLDPDLPDSGPYGLTGWIFQKGDQYLVTDLKGRLGSTDISGTLTVNTETEIPELSGAFSSRFVNVDDLTTPGDLIYPVEALNSLKTDLTWEIKRLQADAVEIGDLAIQGNLTDGRLVVSPFKGKLVDKNVAYADIQGDLEFDAAASVPTFSGKTFFQNMNFGHLMNQLEMDEPMSGTGNLEVGFSSQGHSLFTMLAHPTFKVESTNIQLTSQGQNEEPEFVMNMEQVSLSSIAGGPIKFTSEGSYDNTPFSLTASSGDLKDLFLNQPPKWPLDLSAKMPKMLVDLSGHLNFPFDGEDFTFHLSFKGEALRELDLLEKGFSPDIVVPLTLDGVLTQTREGYTLTDIEAERGSNNLTGHLSFITTGRRPKVVAQLISDSYEFGFLTRTITEAIDEPENQPIIKNLTTTVTKAGKKAAESVIDLGTQTGKMVTESLGMDEESSEEPVDRFFPDFEIPVDALRAVDLDIEWQIKDIQSKGTNLGHGEWTVALKNGLLSFDPINFDLWHGAFSGKIELDASLYVPTLAIDLKVQGLDYGFLDTSVGLKDLIRGNSESISLNVKGRGLTFHEILSRANGTAAVVDGAITITNEYIDLWAADIFTIALSKAWEKEEVTKFNCLVAHMDIVDGKVQSDAILFDTDRITVGGFGTLDLGTEQVDLILTPQPKNPTLVTLGHPVRVSGSLADPDVTSDKLRIAQGGGWYLLGLINPIGLVVVVPKITGTTIGTGKENPCANAMKDKELTVKEVAELQEGFWDWSFRKLKGVFQGNDDSTPPPPNSESEEP
jgi:uncharacterized protein involved in outer membrane biogenesis